MTLLTLTQVTKRFSLRQGWRKQAKTSFAAIHNISFQLAEGETLGIVGESGCGKTTLARTIIRLYEPDAGQILFQNQDLSHLKSQDLRSVRRDITMIFQDPFSSLNPRMSVREIIGEPLLIHKKLSKNELSEEVTELLKRVELSPDYAARYPHEFSGGQRQRIGIARALALKPKLVIADEPISSLDVSVGAQIIELMKELQTQYGMAYLFIAHDLHRVHHLSHKIAVMYLGEIVEYGSKAALESPLHPYTRSLVASIPVPDPRKRKVRQLLAGEVPSPVNPPSGCTFHPRCPFAESRCRTEKPALKEWKPGHFAACHLADKI